ncbi:MAG: sigma-70 family RNA polymerase sigma factor [bacterium]|nr:sigma-70 family RNA polymerase sigma factor [bacterium]
MSVIQFRASKTTSDAESGRDRAARTRDRGDRAERLLEALEAGYGREEVFRKLYELYRRPVHACFARRGFSAEECRDLTQETFLHLYQGIARFRGQSRFETWLFEITTNVWRNEIRNRSALKRDMYEVGLEDAAPWEPRGTSDGDLPGKSVDPEPLEDLLAEERVRVLRDALEELPPQMRRCVQLRLDQDLKFREIAVLMQVSIDTVKSQMAQAKQRLRIRLGGYFEEVPI